jgi:voltage-gated potassium channel
MDLGARWRGVGAQVTVVLTLAVAVLSLLTGIANIGAQEIAGPLADVIPRSIQRTAGFTGALTGFLMIASALGLRRGLRAAWSSTVLLLPLTAIQGLVQSSPLSVPLLVLSALSFPVVLVNRGRFAREVHLSTTQLAALAAVAGAQAYGTVGTYALREEFAAVSTLADAFYYTLVTASTVGYGDATPTTQTAKLYAMSVIVVGVASFGIAIGTLLGPAIEARFASALGRMTDTQLELLENHILVLGYGDLTEPILDEVGSRAKVVIVTPDDERVAELVDRGYNVLDADPSDEEPLRRAGIDRARAVLVATEDDAQDALAVLTAAELNPSIPVVAAATNRENVQKLRRAGADTVISPASIGGRLLVESALGSEGMEAVADRIVGEATGDAADGDDDGDG